MGHRDGWGLNCEKPLSQNAKDCEEIINRELEIGKRLVQVGFMRHYDRGYAEMKRNLALDVIAVAVGHLDLHVDEAALLGPHQHDLGVVIALVGVGGLADLDALDVLILVVQQPAADVQLVDGPSWPCPTT